MCMCMCVEFIFCGIDRCQSLDVADAIFESLHSPATISQVVEVFGPEEYTHKDIARIVNKLIRKPNKTLFVPSPIAKVFFGLTDLLWVQFFLSKEDVVRTTIDDTFDKHALTLSDLNITPTPFEKVALNWLRRFRSPSLHDDFLGN
eukprot:m.33978 g.33978  ORF g.33978 m.33978 type:complete len:146 (-) comp9888_c1_seq2:207-644(-)